MDGVCVDWSGAPCTMAEGELILPLGLLDMEGDLIDWETELEFEMPSIRRPCWSRPALRGLQILQCPPL